MEYSELKPPYICLLVSGGHTQIIVCESFGTYKVIGETIDDACGEAFDKVGNRDKEYLRAIEMRGSISKDPQLHLSTIHGAKGGEAGAAERGRATRCGGYAGGEPTGIAEVKWGGR